MQIETSGWSGEGEFTARVLEYLRALDEVAYVRVEDAEATRSEADYNFISNEIYVAFGTVSGGEEPWWRFWRRSPAPQKRMSIAQLEATLSSAPGIGEPDYGDEGMLQYLKAERIVPPYQTRGYKLVELVRIYEVRNAPHDGIEPLGSSRH